MGLVVKKKVKGLAKSQGLRLSKSGLSELDERVSELILRAVNRAKAARRKTVFGADW